MIVINAKNISKTYNPDKVPVHALNHVDLEIKKGEFTAIVGPSGSGKSTLLNIIGGLDVPTEGTIELGGEDISKFSDNELIDFRLQHIGFVFQAYNLIPVLTAEENVEFIMLLQKQTEKDRKARTVELLTKVGLKDQMNRRPSELSGGQQQRVAVARALASRPEFILADEPTANLDSHSTATLLDMMANMNEKEGATFVFSTHDQRVIDKARRVITLEDGKIVSDEVR
ncbi:ABC transporter ATP-binding protein [Imperialibacter roseus]|uniref:ABC transporter ATP-binding protein n=1 Tax=Imperialibacter roseus TaxID=1324217 RepID=A0ABZ0IT84_9BACT|nr:ABC transporter ATP-binding protein [Imperialibacter roseus]WOK08220.1 ABC transporter ATP-binding protein [Imperialibacter roseus]|tara:strand:+ start:7833 stop:8516 length:684 start_codon:yes stop_codon:yes gene_type:complete